MCALKVFCIAVSRLFFRAKIIHLLHRRGKLSRRVGAMITTQVLLTKGSHKILQLRQIAAPTMTGVNGERGNWHGANWHVNSTISPLWGRFQHFAAWQCSASHHRVVHTVSGSWKPPRSPDYMVDVLRSMSACSCQCVRVHPSGLTGWRGPWSGRWTWKCTREPSWPSAVVPSASRRFPHSSSELWWASYEPNPNQKQIYRGSFPY